MKTLLIVAVALFAAAACLAQPADVDVTFSGDVPQIVVWEEVTTDVNGQPLIEGDVVTYEVFRKHSVSGNEVSLGVVTAPEMTVDLSSVPRGYYYIGVRSVGENAEGATEYSDIAWSNDLAAVDPTTPFAYLVKGRLFPVAPTGLQTVTP